MTSRLIEALPAPYERESARRPSSLHGQHDDTAALRRRADALLDEMMLGGVGGDTNGDIDRRANDSGVSFPNGSHVPEADDQVSYRAGGAMQYPPEVADGAAPSRLALYPVQPAAPLQTDDDSIHWGADTQRTTADAGAATPYLIAAEDRYPQSLPQGDVRGEYANGAYTVMRRQNVSLAHSMTVGSRFSLRSTLLPRSMESDAAAAEQEIHALMSEVSAALPVGHEAAERSRHLLSKAENILQSDPTRTAEVDYYLHQVRRIVLRTRQSQMWSALYQRRLTIYLAAWIALSIVILAGRYMLQAELLAFLEDFFWIAADSVWVQFAPLTIGAMAAASLGSALSVLLNMQRHAAQEYGYFDRKYGLRGLLLPLLGVVFGLIFALVWGAICHFAGLDGTDIWIASIPVAAAFLLGFGQEWLYGAR